MWARVRLDIAWSDLAFGIRCCLLGGDRAGLQRRVEELWSSDGDALACYSVRSGFDLLLSALALPAGSEILFSALNVKGMIRIAKRHGLVPIPVDLELGSMGPRLDALERAITPQSRAIVVAHLFGARLELEPLLAIARRHGLLVIEDCAQAFAGREYTGHPGADVSMFSFGPLKTASAVGGALLRVRDEGLHAEMRSQLSTHPLQTRRSYLVRLLAFGALKLVTTRIGFGLLARVFRLWAGDYEDPVANRVRGVSRLGTSTEIRHQPSAAMLAVLNRRLERWSDGALKRRAQAGRRLLALLDDAVPCPGSRNPIHSYWVFPILVDDLRWLVDALRREGFDAAGLPRSQAVSAPDDRPELDPMTARRAIESLVVLPCHADMPESELARQARIVRRLMSSRPLPAVGSDS